MKKIFAIVGAVLMMGMTSCVHNLNVESIDPNTKSTIDMQELFVKCYATLALTGQKGSDGNGDVAGLDEGTSSFYRMMFSLNEYCADQIYWIWPDVGVDDIRKATWNSSNALVRGVYSRFYFDITLCNLFIDKFAEEAGPRKTAEVRFIRALNYYYLLDMFGNVPKVWKSGLMDLPEQYQRADLYKDLIAELESLEGDLAPAGNRESYYRVDQAAAWLLLSRIYLNAAIYTGKPEAECKADYDKAAEYADKVINSSYDLASEYRFLLYRRYAGFRNDRGMEMYPFSCPIGSTLLPAIQTSCRSKDRRRGSYRIWSMRRWSGRDYRCCQRRSCDADQLQW